MINNNPRWVLRLYHYPTGISVETNSNLFRTQREGYDSLLKLLRSRIWAKTNGVCNLDDIVATYDTGDICYVDDLTEYREYNDKRT